MSSAPLIYFGVPAAGALIALLFLFFSIRAGRKRRLVENLPTSKTAGVFIGLVEVKGTAEVEQPLVSYLAEHKCVYYSWNVDEHWSRTVTETYTDSDGKTKTRTRTESGWTTVASGTDQKSFYVKDDMGIVLVQPEKAKIEAKTIVDRSCGIIDPMYYGKGPALAVADSTFVRRFVERAISMHAPLYVVGPARERKDVVAPEIAFNKDAEMFLISTRTEDQIRRGLGWKYWLLLIFGLIFAVGGMVLRDVLIKQNPRLEIAIYMLAAAAYLAAWLLGWIVMVYNSLVSIRGRVKQGWSNVYVQLKRRSDLIPRLIDVVKGMRDYEKSVQTQLGELRSQSTATSSSDDGSEPKSVSPVISAIVERYPELSSNTLFVNLQKELIETEQRIALARAYFNEIATFYNTRLERVPDRFIANLGGMRPQTLMAAEDFARAPVKVNFAP